MAVRTRKLRISKKYARELARDVPLYYRRATTAKWKPLMSPEYFRDKWDEFEKLAAGVRFAIEVK